MSLKLRLIIIVLFIFVFITLPLTVYTQTCNGTVSLKKNIDRNFYSKNLDSVSYYLNKFPRDHGICLQEYLICKISLCIEKKYTDSSLILFQELDKSLNENFNKKIKNEETLLKGNYYYIIESPDSALYYYLQALEKSKELTDTLLQIKSLNGISIVFANLYQFDKAASYAQQALHYSRIKKHKAYEILSLGNLISFYGKLYQSTENKVHLDSAKSVSIKLAREAKKENNTYALLKAYQGLGSCHFQYEDYQTTLAYSDSIIQLAGNGKYPKLLLQAYANICDSYLSLGKFSLARVAADSALYYAIQQKNSIAISELYYKIYDCEYELKNYFNALEYYKKYTETKDSIQSEEQFSLVNELEQKYNKIENEKVISDLTKEKEISSLRIKILIVSIVLIAVLVGFIIFFFRQRSLRQKHALLETEQRLNRSRINPHFFFNSITTLQGIALKENDGKKIYTNLFTFSKLMRETLESTYSDLIPISKEISFLMNYVDLQKLNRKNKFTFEVKVSSHIDQDSVLIPAMIIQPFIENSIEHGLSKLKNEELGKIILELNIRNEELIISIIDNGVGLNNSQEKKGNYTSRAMQITTDRLNLINNLHGTQARFTLQSNPEGGTKAEIYLPLGLKDESPRN